MPDPAARLLDEIPGPAALELLRRHGVAEPERAARELRALAADTQARVVLGRLLPALIEAVAAVPDPDAALLHLERFVRASGGGAGVLAVLHDRGAQSLELLLWGLGGSPFLAGSWCAIRSGPAGWPTATRSHTHGAPGS
jgi:glutamine synthetase adenylyltransferase